MIVIQRMTLIQMMKKRGALSNNAEALALRDDPEVI